MQNDRRSDEKGEQSSPTEINIYSLNPDVAQDQGVTIKGTLRAAYGFAALGFWVSNWVYGIWAAATHNQQALEWAHESRWPATLIAILAAAWAFGPSPRWLIQAIRSLFR